MAFDAHRQQHLSNKIVWNYFDLAFLSSITLWWNEKKNQLGQAQFKSWRFLSITELKK